MEKLPKFPEEYLLAEKLKTPAALEAYEKLYLGGQIKKMRRKAKLTQSALAKMLKTSQSVVARMEAGRQNFTIRTLINISIFLKKKIHIGFD